MKANDIPTPFYIVYEDKLRHNLELISKVKREAGVNIIMAFKANALWKTFPIIREYVTDSTASSLNEMQLGNEELRGNVHTYCPAYTPDTIGQFIAGSSHITFNSINQWKGFKTDIEAWNAMDSNHHVSPGLRVNPQCSVIETDIYNPALPGSRFGVTADMIGDSLPEGIEGLHFHSLCESDSHALAKVLDAFEQQFGKYLRQVKWVNMGGGHLMTREGYDVNHLIHYPFQRIRIDTSLIVEIRAKQLPVANAEQHIKECCNVIRIYTLFYGYSCHVIRCCAENI